VLEMRLSETDVAGAPQVQGAHARRDLSLDAGGLLLSGEGRLRLVLAILLQCRVFLLRSQCEKAPVASGTL
jgi:hypothetical protein